MKGTVDYFIYIYKYHFVSYIYGGVCILISVLYWQFLGAYFVKGLSFFGSISFRCAIKLSLWDISFLNFIYLFIWGTYCYVLPFIVSHRFGNVVFIWFFNSFSYTIIWSCFTSLLTPLRLYPTVCLLMTVKAALWHYSTYNIFPMLVTEILAFFGTVFLNQRKKSFIFVNIGDNMCFLVYILTKIRKAAGDNFV